MLKKLLQELCLFIIIGIFAGFMSGMFGVGGGSIRIPLLNISGLSLIDAFGTNLFVIPVSSFIGAINHRAYINFKVSKYILIGGIVGAVIGALLSGLLNALVLALLFVAISIVTIIGIQINKIRPDIIDKINPSHANFIEGALLINFITGMRGGSGGSLFPSFLRAMKMNIREAIATSLFCTIFTALIASFIYWNRGNIALIPSTVVLVGSVLGTYIGSKISIKTRSNWLDIGLSIVIIFLSLLVLVNALFM